MSPFILPCLPFSLTGERKSEKSLCRGVDELHAFYLLRHANGQTHVCLIASSVKIITIKCIAVVYGFKSPGWFDVETYMHVFGCDMPIQLVLSSEYNDYDRL